MNLFFLCVTCVGGEDDVDGVLDDLGLSRFLIGERGEDERPRDEGSAVGNWTGRGGVTRAGASKRCLGSVAAFASVCLGRLLSPGLVALGRTLADDWSSLS